MASISALGKNRQCKKERTFCFQGFAVVSALSHFVHIPVSTTIIMLSFANASIAVILGQSKVVSDIAMRCGLPDHDSTSKYDVQWHALRQYAQSRHVG